MKVVNPSAAYENALKHLMHTQPFHCLDSTETSIMLAGVRGLADAAAELLPIQVLEP